MYRQRFLIDDTLSPKFRAFPAIRYAARESQFPVRAKSVSGLCATGSWSCVRQ